MPVFLLDKFPQVDGNHFIHKKGCIHLPESNTVLGLFQTERIALDKALSTQKNVILCPHCTKIQKP